MTNHVDIPAYLDFLPIPILEECLSHTREVEGLEGFRIANDVTSDLESVEALTFICKLYERTCGDLNHVLRMRKRDRQFIDHATKNYSRHNTGRDYHCKEYRTVIGQKDSSGRVVVGPLHDHFLHPYGEHQVAPIPEFLRGNHITLFGPPDTKKMSINAMNAWHRKLSNEPDFVTALIENSNVVPMWGADDEDSKTPMHADLVAAQENLIGCLKGTLTFDDPASGKEYRLQPTRLSQPLKRFPGLALPCSFAFLHGSPIPLHIYDFAMHVYHCWDNPKALVFYVPKLENEEEAHYLHGVISLAEQLLQAEHPDYVLGTVRIMCVLENPRVMFRVNEVIDALYPYFVGASLGWHDYLASGARLFKEDPQYRIPVKADPNIVINHIRESHKVLNDVVGPRGGIKIGGMYGVLPKAGDAPSLQVTLEGFMKDVITQMKRGLDGFWVAHPDFVRIGIALVEAWRLWEESAGANDTLMQIIAFYVLDTQRRETLKNFVTGPDRLGLNHDNPVFPRALLAADCKESDVIPNNDPKEVRYNIFQALQYLADWLSGNGCVALPAHTGGAIVRVMDDLATTERSRWELWCEFYHGRVSLMDFNRYMEEEMEFIRENRATDSKEVQVTVNAQTEKWYPVAFNILKMLVVDSTPVEFVTELTLTFTIPFIRQSENPWESARQRCPQKFWYPPLPIPHAESLQLLLDKYKVPGVSIALLRHGGYIEARSAGYANVGAKVPMSPETMLQIASLSKTVGTVFAMEYFDLHNIPMSTPVNQLLSSVGKRVPVVKGGSADWSDALTLLHLVTHTGCLGLHYVSGCKEQVPPPGELLFGSGRPDLGYPPVQLSGKPGSTFAYSGAGFIMLQYVLEVHSGKDIEALMQLFLERCGVSGALQFTWPAGGARGYAEDGSTPFQQLLFPPLAAGGFGTATAVAKVLDRLTAAYVDIGGSGPISHDTAIHMLFPHNITGDHHAACLKFMSARLGMGTFVAVAGRNRIAVHQAANDGFRGVYVACYAGPDAGHAMVLLNNGNDNGALLNAELLATLLQEEGWSGMQWDKVTLPSAIDNSISQANRVNFILRDAVFNAFEEDMAETVSTLGVMHPQAQYNAAANAVILHATEQGFARASNLFLPTEAVFEPSAFGRQGKIMDSWETIRHNVHSRGHYVHFALAQPTVIKYVEISTIWHDGNHCHAFALDNRKAEDEWAEIIGESPLQGHTVHRLVLAEPVTMTEGRLWGVPDGGISRFALFGENLPADYAALFPSTNRVSEPIPPVIKPVGSTEMAAAQASERSKKNHSAEKSSHSKLKEVGRSLSQHWSLSDVSNQHYGPAIAVISEEEPQGMFDGFESSRSRVSGNSEFVVIEFEEKPMKIQRIILDFCYFVNNNPMYVSIFGRDITSGEWRMLLEKKYVKPYRGSQAEIYIHDHSEFTALKVQTLPDGGMNRVHIFPRATYGFHA
jgi:malate synthase